MANPQLDMIVQLLRAQRPATLPPVATLRANMEQMVGLMPLPGDVAVEPVKVGSDATIPADWVSTPGASADHAVLYLHGGGYVMGSPRTHRDLAGRLSRAAQARVLVIDYRLAPEHPFPAAVDDATAAWRWLLAQGLEPGRMAIAGDSAGGGLTIASLLALRDAGAPLPAAAAALSPWTDLEGTGASADSKGESDPMISKEFLIEIGKLYLNGTDPKTPLAAPLHGNLAGLPPLLVQVGTEEVLLDDSTRLAERAKQAGVEVTLEVWDDMIHVFQAFAAMLPEGQQAIEKIAAFLRARW